MRSRASSRDRPRSNAPHARKRACTDRTRPIAMIQARRRVAWPMSFAVQPHCTDRKLWKSAGAELRTKEEPETPATRVQGTRRAGQARARDRAPAPVQPHAQRPRSWLQPRIAGARRSAPPNRCSVACCRSPNQQTPPACAMRASRDRASCLASLLPWVAGCAQRFARSRGNEFPAVRRAAAPTSRRAPQRGWVACRRRTAESSNAYSIAHRPPLTAPRRARGAAV